MHRHAVTRRAARAALGIIAMSLAAACAPAANGGGGRIAFPGPAPRAAAGFAGFDTGIYPGDAALRAWRQASPYQWVGYYLTAPCHRDVSWSGKREQLVAMGWGTAVIYLGQQDWGAMPSRAPAAADTAARADSTAMRPQQPAAVAAPPPACSAANLSAARGTADAADAIARTAGEGFPSGAVVYLDVERVTAVSPALADYVRAWVDGVLADGRYLPGIYVHRLNADAIGAAAGAAYTARGRAGGPPLWVTSSTGFSLELPPTASGVAGATVWQGPLDVRETWGGITLQIDANVANTRSPSAPLPGSP